MSANLGNTEAMWYLDTGASNHITPDIESLSLHNPYKGSTKVAIGNG